MPWGRRGTGRSGTGLCRAGPGRHVPPQPPGQYLRSRLVLVGGGLLMAGVAALTSGTARLVAVVVVGVGAVAAWALYDHRTERRRGDSA